MIRLVIVAVAVAVTAASQTACVTGVPRCCAIVVPARYDAGAAVASDRAGGAGHFAMGASWASGTPNAKPPVDVLMGMLLDVRGGPDPIDQTGMPGVPKYVPGRYIYGNYVEVDGRIAGTRSQRVFLGLRGEVLVSNAAGRDEGLIGAGLTARASWEWFHAGKGPTWSGALAIGGFIEATARTFQYGAVEHGVVAGLSYRVPLKLVPVPKKR